VRVATAGCLQYRSDARRLGAAPDGLPGQADRRHGVRGRRHQLQPDRVRRSHRRRARRDSRSTRVDVTNGGTIEVSRLGGKSVVAARLRRAAPLRDRGLQGTSARSPAHAKVTIDTQATAVVRDRSRPAGSAVQRSARSSSTWPTTNGKPIDGTVSWLLTGPRRRAGAANRRRAIATKNGDAKIHVDDSRNAGSPKPCGIRVPWATSPLPLVTAFDVSGSTTLTLPGGNLGGHPSCDVRGHSGGRLPTLVCLAPRRRPGVTATSSSSPGRAPATCPRRSRSRRCSTISSRCSSTTTASPTSRST